MKKKFKKFTFYGTYPESWEGEFFTFEGRDIYDAYRKACEEYDYIRRPYKSKPSTSKKIKKAINKRIRHHKFDDSPMDQRFFVMWIAYRKGVVEFD